MATSPQQLHRLPGPPEDDRRGGDRSGRTPEGTAGAWSRPRVRSPGHSGAECAPGRGGHRGDEGAAAATHRRAGDSAAARWRFRHCRTGAGPANSSRTPGSGARRLRRVPRLSTVSAGSRYSASRPSARERWWSRADGTPVLPAPAPGASRRASAAASSVNTAPSSIVWPAPWTSPPPTTRRAAAIDAADRGRPAECGEHRVRGHQ